MTWTYDLGGRLYLRPMTDSLEDGYTVSGWRNTDMARRMFYHQEVVTPDTHAAFMCNRAPNDLLWMVHIHPLKDQPGPAIGMASLTIAVHDYTAEYGRAFIEPGYRGQGYGQEMEYMVLALAFEFFHLRLLWADVLAHNEAARDCHRETGWKDMGLDIHGHPSDRGPVWHIEYPREVWTEQRQKFIDGFGVTL